MGALIALVILLCYLAENGQSIQNLDYDKIMRDLPLFKKKPLQDAISTQLLGNVDVYPYIGTENEPVTNSHDLDCDFSKPCCWSNVGIVTDQLDWGIAQTDPDQVRAQNVLSDPGPSAPFLISSSQTTSSLSYADLFSCVIDCQTGPGTLTFQHWSSPSVKFDICTVEVGQTQFSNCQTVSSQTPTESTISIPAISNPFQIAIVSSEFTTTPGGVALIKQITYEAPVCGSPTTPGGGGACAPVDCTFDSGMCSYQSVGTRPWETRSGKTSNYASGVPFNPPGHNSYMGTQFTHNDPSTAQAKSAVGNFRDGSQVRFRYFESAYGGVLRGCVDDESNCPFTTADDVTASDRQWKDGQFNVPSGQHTVLFVAQNKDGQYTGVGLSDVRVTDPSGNPTGCS